MPIILLPHAMHLFIFVKMYRQIVKSLGFLELNVLQGYKNKYSTHLVLHTLFNRHHM